MRNGGLFKMPDIPYGSKYNLLIPFALSIASWVLIGIFLYQVAKVVCRSFLVGFTGSAKTRAFPVHSPHFPTSQLPTSM
jgi:hypothetical protein